MRIDIPGIIQERDIYLHYTLMNQAGFQHKVVWRERTQAPSLFQRCLIALRRDKNNPHFSTTVEARDFDLDANIAYVGNGRHEISLWLNQHTEYGHIDLFTHRYDMGAPIDTVKKRAAEIITLYLLALGQWDYLHPIEDVSWGAVPQRVVDLALRMQDGLYLAQSGNTTFHLAKPNGTVTPTWGAEVDQDTAREMRRWRFIMEAYSKSRISYWTLNDKGHKACFLYYQASMAI